MHHELQVFTQTTSVVRALRSHASLNAQGFLSSMSSL